MLDNGFFYYKELPSLQRIGNNTIILETLSIAYRFTNDKKYLVAGKNTFNATIKKATPLGSKMIKNDIVLLQGQGTKFFSQAFYPLLRFYNLLGENNMI